MIFFFKTAEAGGDIFMFLFFVFALIKCVFLVDFSCSKTSPEGNVQKQLQSGSYTGFVKFKGAICNIHFFRFQENLLCYQQNVQHQDTHSKELMSLFSPAAADRRPQQPIVVVFNIDS